MQSFSLFMLMRISETLHSEVSHEGNDKEGHNKRVGICLRTFNCGGV